MYRFLLTPRWILSHLFVGACVVAMLWAGFWQLGRLDERRAANAEVLVAQDLPVTPIREVLPGGPDSTDQEVSDALYRAVTVTGTYRTDDQVLVRNRTYEGAPGYWVLTPLVQADGTAVAVNRGWVPFDVQPDGPWDRFAPPTGTVTVTGLVREPQVRSTGGIVSGPEDAAEGRLRTLSRVDVGRLAQQSSTPLLPVYVDLRTQEPPQPAQTPTILPPPELSEGPHLGYAGQWFIFALLTSVVYVLLLRRAARNRAAPPPTDEAAAGEEHAPAPVGS